MPFLDVQDILFLGTSFLMFGSNAWVRLSRKSLFVPLSGHEMLH